MSEFLALISGSPRKRVPLDDLKRHYYALHPDVQNSPDRASLLLAALRQLEAQGALKLPAAGSWEPAGALSLPKWVQLVREDEIAEREDFSLVPWVPEMGFWPDLKPQQLDTAKAVNAFLLKRRGNFKPIPIKERSLEIFGDEKKLDSLRAGSTLFAGRLNLAQIGAFVAPLPLPYRPAAAPGKPVLVVENHNSYWSLGEWNMTAKVYSAVVYGAGEAFRSTGAALGQVLLETDGIGAEYLGDLDTKGVRIPQDFNEACKPGDVQVRPALRLYAWLLDNGRRRSKPECALGTAELAMAWLGAHLGLQLHLLWSEGLWVPQESLGFEQLQKAPFTP